jgi:hypothetical protein
MVRSQTRTILGISILIATFFFMLNSVQEQIVSPNSLGILILVIGSLVGYFLGRVVVLNQSFIPEFIKVQIRGLMKR